MEQVIYIYSICISYFVVTKELLLNFDPIECIQKRDLTAASLVCDVLFVLLQIHICFLSLDI